MTAWLFDLGNSRFKFAPLQQQRAGQVQVLEHNGQQALEPQALQALPQGSVAYVASVASAALREQLLQALAGRFERVELVTTSASCAGVTVAYAEPARFGVDRFLALIGAYGHGPVLVAGVGTALTLDLLDGEGLHRGGLISASPTTMREALHARAAQLPIEGGEHVAFASDTLDALASGCEGAAVALIERNLAQAAVLLGEPVQLLLHGGGAAPLLSWLPQGEYRPSLVLDGLASWATQQLQA